MRKKLKIHNGQRLRFKGIFEQYGLKTAYRGFPLPTLLLRDVTIVTGEEITDHLWFNLTKGFDALGDLYPGDVVAFDARVRARHRKYRFIIT